MEEGFLYPKNLFLALLSSMVMFTGQWLVTNRVVKEMIQRIQIILHIKAFQLRKSSHCSKCSNLDATASSAISCTHPIWGLNISQEVNGSGLMHRYHTGIADTFVQNWTIKPKRRQEMSVCRFVQLEIAGRPKMVIEQPGNCTLTQAAISN